MNSLNGKIIRINPENGDGIRSNPFFDEGNPRSAKSRIWAYGLRNPFRFSVKPNSGSKNVLAGNPGVLLVGDVGWKNREEFNIIPRGGLNFGWPRFEGINHQNEIFDNQKFIPERPTKPVVDWRQGAVQAQIGGEAFDIGSVQFNGNNFNGNASIGGVWYPDDEHFPAEFRNTYFHGDFEYWVKCFKFDEFISPKEVIEFSTDVHPTCFAVNPKNGAIYYTNYSYPDIHEIRQISYSPNQNLKPTAVISADKTYGASPLQVKFSGSNSRDPEGEPMKFEWDFGDNSSSDDVNPEHTYSIPFGEKNRFTVTLKITDNVGQISTKNIQIFVGNAPPIIQKTTIDTLSQFDNAKDFTVKLDAQVANADKEKINYQWSVVLHHDDHSHFQTAVNNQQGQAVLASIPCDGQKYFYRVALKVTDSLGLSSTIYRDITPICKKVVVIEPPPPPSTSGKLMLFALKKNETVAVLKWASVIKNTGGFFYEIYKNGQLVRRIDQSAKFVEVSIDRTKAINEYQILAKDVGGNVVSSNLAWITTSLTVIYSIFNFEQTLILLDFIILELEKDWAKQLRKKNEDCPEEMTFVTTNLIEKIARNNIVSIEKINQKTIFKAGKSIELKPGFEAEKTYFETKIEGCEN